MAWDACNQASVHPHHPFLQEMYRLPQPENSFSDLVPFTLMESLSLYRCLLDRVLVLACGCGRGTRDTAIPMNRVATHPHLTFSRRTWHACHGRRRKERNKRPLPGGGEPRRRDQAVGGRWGIHGVSGPEPGVGLATQPATVVDCKFQAHVLAAEAKQVAYCRHLLLVI